MKHTNRQLSEATVADMYRAMDRHHPVTITYTKADGSTTVRTIEPYEIRTTKAGAIIVKAMDRQSGESRTFRVDRVESYTTHRTAFVVERSDAMQAPAAPRTPAGLTAYEIARDDRAYWGRRDEERAADYDHAA